MPLSLITLTDWGFEILKSGDRTCIQLACLMVSRTIKMASGLFQKSHDEIPFHGRCFYFVVKIGKRHKCALPTGTPAVSLTSANVTRNSESK